LPYERFGLGFVARATGTARVPAARLIFFAFLAGILGIATPLAFCADVLQQVSEKMVSLAGAVFDPFRFRDNVSGFRLPV
jgi:hypothetical protein